MSTDKTQVSAPVPPAWRDGRCTCCDASVAGWSDTGRQRGLRDGVARVRRAAHGTCSSCGRPLDQYRECDHTTNITDSGHGLDQVGPILAGYGLINPDTTIRQTRSTGGGQR